MSKACAEPWLRAIGTLRKPCTANDNDKIFYRSPVEDCVSPARRGSAFKERNYPRVKDCAPDRRVQHARFPHIVRRTSGRHDFPAAWKFGASSGRRLMVGWALWIALCSCNEFDFSMHGLRNINGGKRRGVPLRMQTFLKRKKLFSTPLLGERGVGRFAAGQELRPRPICWHGLGLPRSPASQAGGRAAVAAAPGTPSA